MIMSQKLTQNKHLRLHCLIFITCPRMRVSDPFWQKRQSARVNTVLNISLRDTPLHNSRWHCGQSPSCSVQMLHCHHIVILKSPHSRPRNLLIWEDHFSSYTSPPTKMCRRHSVMRTFAATPSVNCDHTLWWVSTSCTGIAAPGGASYLHRMG